MNAEKAGTDDIEVLVKMRLNYLLEDNGSLDARIWARTCSSM